MIRASHFHDNGDGTAWWIVKPVHRLGVTNTVGDDYYDPSWFMSLDRPCDTCDGTTRIACPGPSVEPKTQMGRDAAGLVAGKDYCYGMHMGHPCPDCESGRHTFTVEVETPVGEVYVQAKHRTRTLTVSVVPGMVLPIYGNEFGGWQISAADAHLPPAAKPGMWAVKLAVQS